MHKRSRHKHAAAAVLAYKSPMHGRRCAPDDGRLVFISVDLQRPLLESAEEAHELRLLPGQVVAGAGSRAEADAVLQHLQDRLPLYDSQHVKLMPRHLGFRNLLRHWKGLQPQRKWSISWQQLTLRRCIAEAF